jgi:CRP-like cAMP-binding protein
VLHKGGQGEHLLFLLSGRLQAVDVSEEGREIGLSIIMPGDYFGDLAIIDGQPRSASVIASEASLVAFLPRTQALDLIYNTPLVAERMLKRMASKIRDASNYRAILGIPNAFQRVFALLNQFARVAPGGLVVIDKMPSQQEIAIMVNTSRETVSRAIHSLIQKGVVEKDMRRLIVRLPDALRDAVRSDSAAADNS